MRADGVQAVVVREPLLDSVESGECEQFVVPGDPRFTSTASSLMCYAVVSVVRGGLMAKGQPFSVRLQEGTERVVEAEARRTKRTKSAVVEAFTEETACTRRFPGIAFRGDDARRRAWVIGSGLDVWELIHMLEDFGSVEALLSDTPLTAAQIRLAVAYREAYPEEVDAAIAENRPVVADLDLLYPFIAVAGD
jgi:uncharacterized protein (DUF433 family)